MHGYWRVLQRYSRDRERVPDRLLPPPLLPAPALKEYVRDRSMQQNLPINRAELDKTLGHGKPLSSMTHEIGMASVAAELHLGIDELELDAADSVERGAAALFLAGFGPKPAASLLRSRTAKGSGRNTGRSASARRSRKPTRPAR